MTDLAFTNLLAVCAIAFAAPLLARTVRAVVVPAVVLELVAGIAVGPAGLGWVEVDDPVGVLALLGLATLLFLAGLELEPEALRSPLARQAALGFVLSISIALIVGLGLQAAGLTRSALFVAIVLSATSLGVVVPVLKDAGLERAAVGQAVVLGASIADVATIVLLSLLFSEQAASLGSQAVLLGGLVVFAAALLAVTMAVGRSPRVGTALQELQDTTAQIRVRGAVLVLIAFVAVAQRLGLEVILGAFIAGATFAAVDRDRGMTHPALRTKLDAIGYGLLIPVFFVTSGLRFDLAALTQDAATLARVPLFLAALLAVRAVPAVVYRSALDGPRQVVAAGLLQATSLPFIVAASMIGVELDLVSTADAAGLVAAGLASVVLFPPLAVALLGPRSPVDRLPAHAPGASMPADAGQRRADSPAAARIERSWRSRRAAAPRW